MTWPRDRPDAGSRPGVPQGNLEKSPAQRRVFERREPHRGRFGTTDGSASPFCERSKKENFAWSPSFGRVVMSSRRSFDALRQSSTTSRSRANFGPVKARCRPVLPRGAPGYLLVGLAVTATNVARPGRRDREQAMAVNYAAITTTECPPQAGGALDRSRGNDGSSRLGALILIVVLTTAPWLRLDIRCLNHLERERFSKCYQFHSARLLSAQCRPISRS